MRDGPSLTCILSDIGEPLGRIQFELFKDVVPKTAENFRQFCTGESKNSAGRPQGYKSSKFHRIVRHSLRHLLPIFRLPRCSQYIVRKDELSVIV